MSERRRICVITGTRAEYGLLSGLLQRMQADSAIELQILATAAHLNSDLGLTYREIEADGFRITKVPMPIDGGETLATAQAVGSGLAALAETLHALHPDIVVVLGDRIELLAAASACLVLGIPLAHIHGGELTEGVIDDAIRHAITKMAHLHFPATEVYRNRILQMGEAPDRVFAVGALGIDNINQVDLIPPETLGKDLDFRLQSPMLIVTYHPETLDAESPLTGCQALLSALDTMPEARIVFTKANADPGGQAINRLIANWTERNVGRAKVFASLGMRRYLSLLHTADAVVGNSSSGIIEAPAMGIPTVNIGERQAGRLRAASILDCPADSDAIAASIHVALSASFREKARQCEPPYGRGGAAERIHQILMTQPLAGLLRKSFVDLPQVRI
ncbi:UDP-N-acetylglucosamine 2-epimerase [Ferrovibrio terrae]|uniref:UDP-N-acetylglucosamine 2-epimerase n=1 Tax=Ferrovibrio terrae TaxID=2594003 RepID=UPI0031378597